VNCVRVTSRCGADTALAGRLLLRHSPVGGDSLPELEASAIHPPPGAAVLGDMEELLDVGPVRGFGEDPLPPRAEVGVRGRSLIQSRWMRPAALPYPGMVPGVW
jgi:hypothetical protein